jgi:hypothetical protein
MELILNWSSVASRVGGRVVRDTGSAEDAAGLPTAAGLLDPPFAFVGP